MFNKGDVIVVREDRECYDEYSDTDYIVDRMENSNHSVYCYPTSGERLGQLHGFDLKDVVLKNQYFIEDIIKDLEILEKRCLIKEI